MSSTEESVPIRARQPAPASANRKPDRQFQTLVKAFWNGEARNGILLLAAGIATVILGTAFGQVRLNAWNRPFYDAIARRDVPTFLQELLVFGLIVSALLILNVAQGWLHQTIRLRLRAWLTRDLIGNWLQNKRAFRITRIGDIGANPDQRIHQDGQHLTDLSTDLGIGLFQSSLLLLSFVGVLWGLSRDVVFPFNGHDYIVPGYMVWSALFYAAIGSWLSWRVGRRLVPLNANHYAREAELRAALVRTHEHAEGIGVYGYEREQARHLFAYFEAVLDIVRQVILANVRLTWVTAGYGWLALVVPIVVASPGYFTGKLSFGELMVVVGAFYQVQQALRWFVDNAGTIADWRATLFRVMSFRNALLGLERLEQDVHRVELAAHPAGRLRFEGMALTMPAGPARFAEGDVEVGPGERVLVVGTPGSGKTVLFLALAGVAPLGAGRILLPSPASTAFLSLRPYVPPGSLRDALALSIPGGENDAARIAALKRVGLDHLSEALDRVERWDRERSVGELYRLACARLILAKPQWVISDLALDLLDEDHSETILSIFDQELADTTVLSLAPHPSPSGFYSRLLHLVGPEPPAVFRDSRGRRGTPGYRPAARAREPVQLVEPR
jgi:putative ATP-binding cassette transporter